MRLRIGIDLMGGDNPPELLFSAILEAAGQLSSDRSLLVIATQPVVFQLSSFLSSSLSAETCARVSFLECEEVITMTDHPLSAVRRKKKSSLVLGMQLLKKKGIDAFVSCGNTGALIACAALTLPLLSGISHPALLAHLPTKKGPAAVLDVGGNVLNKADQLVRFAFLGAAYQRALQGIETPIVGLLNIGVESHKGTSEVSQAYEILKAHCQDAVADRTAPCMYFLGNVEGRDLFTGAVDVLVTDGFTGNVLLKTAEGVSAFIFDSLQDKMQDKMQGKMNDGSTREFEKEFRNLKKQFDYTEYPGAFVCGVDGVVIKVHGNATAESFLASIISAINCVEKHVLAHVKDSVT